MREGPHYLTAYDQMTDEQLCVQAKEGVQDAEELLVRRYQRLVRCLARPYSLAGGDNDDLIQEGIIGLIFAVREYDAENASFHTFAEHCIRNRLYSALRAAARGKHTPLNQSVPLEEPFAENPISLYSSAMSQSDPEDLLIGRENVQELLDGVRQQLSPFETVNTPRPEGRGFSVGKAALKILGWQASFDSSRPACRLRSFAKDTHLFGLMTHKQSRGTTCVPYCEGPCFHIALGQHLRVFPPHKC